MTIHWLHPLITAVPPRLAQPAMIQKTHAPKRRSDGSRRNAVAVVELAVCLPVLVVLLVATIEACVMLQLQQNLAVTAYEGARVGIIPGIDADTVEFQCQLLLDDRNINAYTITLDPVDPQTMDCGRRVYYHDRCRLCRKLGYRGNVF